MAQKLLNARGILRIDLVETYQKEIFIFLINEDKTIFAVSQCVPLTLSTNPVSYRKMTEQDLSMKFSQV